MYTAIVLLLAISQLVIAAATTGCNADNCLRAVRASAFSTVQGTKDCSSFFAVTVTPATQIITSTSTVTTTPGTSTATSTSTVTITPATFTITSIETVTSTPPVVTSTVTSATTTVTLFPSCSPASTYAKRGEIMPPAPPLPFASIAVIRRQITVIPSSVPMYASACSGTVRYSSACSCIGVTLSTTTVAAPQTTTTTIITTAAPTPVTTITITVTVAAATPSVIVSTTSTTTLPAVTTTVTIFAPTATSTPAPYCSFQLIDNNPGDAFNGTYALVDYSPAFGQIGEILQPTDASSATIFTCDNENHLLAPSTGAGDLYAVLSHGMTNSFFIFNDQEYINTYEPDLVICTVNGTGQMTCSVNGSSVLQYCNYTAYNDGFIALLSFEVDDPTKCNVINFMVVPIPC